MAHTHPCSAHLWLALSPHGYGHAAMTAPLVAELRRRRPGLRLTIQTSLSRTFLATHYADFDHVPDIPDFGFCMKSAVALDVPASAALYVEMHADFSALVARETARLTAAKPDLVLANVPYVTLAAASAAGIPVAAYSSLNWADLTDHYLGDRMECVTVRAEIRASYDKADVFLRPQPAQPMTLRNVVDIGPVARLGVDRRDAILHRLQLPPQQRLGLIAFGGIDHRLPLDRWPELEEWTWLSAVADTPVRADMVPWQAIGEPFADILPSVDLVITKPGYGTFSQAGLAGVPVLFEPRPDWPEAPPLESWLAAHTQCLAATAEEMVGGALPSLLQMLFSLPRQPLAQPTGIVEGVDVLERLMDRTFRSS